MKRFLLKISLLSTLMLGLYIFHIHQLSQGFVDMYYPKFEREAGSLILGISREHMGISPAILQAGIGSEKFEGPLLNFAFEKTQSPYGEVYLSAIKKKLKPGVKNGLFILGVTPGGFMVPSWLEENDIKAYDENIMKVANVYSVSASPNYEYIFKFYGASLYTVYDDSRENKIFRRYHQDGWNEFRTEIENKKVTPRDIDEWTLEGVMGARYIKNTERISEYRIEGLHRIAEYLKTRGRVIFVRTPIDTQFIEIEDDFWPDFNDRMNALADHLDISYLNYATPGHAFQTIDGSHLLGEGAIGFSTLLGKDIKNMVFSHTAANESGQRGQ
jgi:hypothetical protein